MKITKRFLLVSTFVAFVMTLTILFGNESIRAQIKNIYDEKSGQVAGITSLMSAVTSNDVDGVRFFIKASKSLINQKNIGGATALHMACREKNLEIVSILLENQASINVSDNEGWTPLMRAALAGDATIVNYLLDHGAKSDSLNSVNESVIIQAASSDCAGCLDAMFKKSDFLKSMNINALKQQLNDAFIIAQNHDNEVTQKLISSYLDQTIKLSLLADNNSHTSSGLEDKTFKVISDEEVVHKSMVAKKKDNRFLVKKSDSSMVKTAQLPDVSNSQSQLSTSSKKFRFVSGPQGNSANSKKISIKKMEKVSVVTEEQPAQAVEIDKKITNAEKVVSKSKNSKKIIYKLSSKSEPIVPVVPEVIESKSDESRNDMESVSNASPEIKMEEVVKAPVQKVQEDKKPSFFSRLGFGKSSKEEKKLDEDIAPTIEYQPISDSSH